MVDNCASFPCKNNGICINQPNSYVCNCLAGYTGSEYVSFKLDFSKVVTLPIIFNSLINNTSCSININYCSNNPCQNGQCFPNLNSYTCFCNAGWTGQNCTTRIDYCASYPCFTGVCVNNETTSSYSCICPTGFYGINCENKERACQSNPCQNGASCYEMSAGGYRWDHILIFITIIVFIYIYERFC